MSKAQDQIPTSDLRVPAGFWSLVGSSVPVRRELLEQGTFTVRTHYTPTDWTKECSDKEFWDGLKPDAGVCPTCFMCLTAAGGCFCTGTV